MNINEPPKIYLLPDLLANVQEKPQEQVLVRTSVFEARKTPKSVIVQFQGNPGHFKRDETYTFEIQNETGKVQFFGLSGEAIIKGIHMEYTPSIGEEK